MYVKKTERVSVCVCVCVKVSERPAKGHYGLSSLTLARLPCARRSTANCKPIRQTATSGSDAPWLVQAELDQWFTLYWTWHLSAIAVAINNLTQQTKWLKITWCLLYFLSHKVLWLKETYYWLQVKVKRDRNTGKLIWQTCLQIIAFLARWCLQFQ